MQRQMAYPNLHMNHIAMFCGKRRTNALHCDRVSDCIEKKCRQGKRLEHACAQVCVLNLAVAVS